MHLAREETQYQKGVSFSGPTSIITVDADADGDQQQLLLCAFASFLTQASHQHQ